MSGFRAVLLDVLVALIILMAGGAIFARIAGVEEGETGPAWVSFGPLVLAMLYLGWRTMRRGRQRREAEERAAEEPLTGYEDEWNVDDQFADGEFADAVDERPPLSDLEWRARVDSAVRNLSGDGFQRFTLALLGAMGLTDLRVQRTAFDGAVEYLAADPQADPANAGAGVYVICRRTFGMIGVNQIRELHRAMADGGHDGLYITNGAFASAARQEAESAESDTRLIDGEALLDLLRSHALGVAVDREGRVTAVDDDWFRALESEPLTREEDRL